MCGGELVFASLVRTLKPIKDIVNFHFPQSSSMSRRTCPPLFDAVHFNIGVDTPNKLQVHAEYSKTLSENALILAYGYISIIRTNGLLSDRLFMVESKWGTG